MEPTITIGKDRAIKLGETEFWKDLSSAQIVEFQLFTQELCMPISVFKDALKICLNRSVFTHELVTDYDNMVTQFLGHKTPPTLADVINLIPAEKRAIAGF